MVMLEPDDSEKLLQWSVMFFVNHIPDFEKCTQAIDEAVRAPLARPRMYTLCLCARPNSIYF